MDLLDNKASLIINVVPPDNIIFALPEPSIKSAGPDIVLTLASTNVNYEKYFLSLRIVCVVALSTRHSSLQLTLE